MGFPRRSSSRVARKSCSSTSQGERRMGGGYRVGRRWGDGGGYITTRRGGDLTEDPLGSQWREGLNEETPPFTTGCFGRGKGSKREAQGHRVGQGGAGHGRGAGRRASEGRREALLISGGRCSSDTRAWGVEDGLAEATASRNRPFQCNGGSQRGEIPEPPPLLRRSFMLAVWGCGGGWDVARECPPAPSPCSDHQPGLTKRAHIRRLRWWMAECCP